MKNHSWVGITGAVIAALATACSGTNTEALEGQSTAASSAEPELPYLFRDPSLTGPRLDVIDADGHFAISVGGPIGTESGMMPSLRPNSSLVELYLALHPTESEVPIDLEVLEELVAPLREMVASIRTEAPPAAAVDKSESAFNSTVCKQFREGSFQYTPVACRWEANSRYLQPTHDLDIEPFDRVYGWNNASSQAQIEFYTCFVGNCPPTLAATLPPYWWTYAWMTGGGPYVASFSQTSSTPNPAGGDRGATHHVESTIIR